MCYPPVFIWTRVGQEKVAKVSERWLGAQPGGFRRCPLDADLLQRRPGVVVLAVEPDKAEIVLEAAPDQHPARQQGLAGVRGCRGNTGTCWQRLGS